MFIVCGQRKIFGNVCPCAYVCVSVCVYFCMSVCELRREHDQHVSRELGSRRNIEQFDGISWDESGRKEKNGDDATRPN